MKGVSVMCIVDFIAMFYINELISFKLIEEGQTFIPSHAKFHEDFYKFKRFFDKKLAEILHDYIILASAMEISNAWYSCDESPYWFLGEKIYFLNEEKLGEKIHKLNLNAYYEMAEYIFGEAYWNDLFGGEKWYKAIKINELYGKIDDTMFCDAIIDLQHNTGSLLDKVNPYFKLKEDKKRLDKIIQRKALSTNFFYLFEFLLENACVQNKRLRDIYWRFITLYISEYSSEYPSEYILKYKKYWLKILQISPFYPNNHYQYEFFGYKPLLYTGKYKKYKIEFSDYIQEEYDELNKRGCI